VAATRVSTAHAQATPRHRFVRRAPAPGRAPGSRGGK
jgi:hypothetical protein